MYNFSVFLLYLKIWKIRIFKGYLILLKIITHFGISPIFGGRHFRGGALPHTLHAAK